MYIIALRSVYTYNVTQKYTTKLVRIYIYILHIYMLYYTRVYIPITHEPSFVRNFSGSHNKSPTPPGGVCGTARPSCNDDDTDRFSILHNIIQRFSFTRFSTQNIMIVDDIINAAILSRRVRVHNNNNNNNLGRPLNGIVPTNSVPSFPHVSLYPFIYIQVRLGTCRRRQKINVYSS